MKAYVGTKVILAEPEEKDGKRGYKVIYPDGYISWSPEAVFETAYREITDGEFDLIMDTVADDFDEDEFKALLDELEGGDIPTPEELEVLIEEEE